MKAKDWDELAEKEKYYQEILSPIKEQKARQKILRKIGRGRKAIDLGCGLGEMIPYLIERYDEVVAIDFSQKMVERAREKGGKVERADLRNLKKYRGFDLAVSINSIIVPSVKEVDKIFKEVRKTLKEGGRLLAVLPSMNSVLYVAMLVYEKQLAKLKDKEKAVARTKKIIGDYGFIRGTFDHAGEQKFYYDFEIEHRLKKAGFEKIKIERLRYPWKALENYEMNFPKEEEPWDWLVEASVQSPK